MNTSHHLETLTHECPGLLAKFPHQWLAAIGATVIADSLRLSWTEDPSPCAILHGTDTPPVKALAKAWPVKNTFERMPIVEYWSLKRQQEIPVGDYRRMTREFVGRRDSWSLAAAATDLAKGKKRGHAARGPLNPGFQGLSSPHASLLKMLDCSKGITAALAGTLPAAEGDGLGLDPMRFTDPSSADGGVATVHPVEVMAFYALALFPLRGGGIISSRHPSPARQRCWTTASGRSSVFRWPAWRDPLDRWAVDALLDAWQPGDAQRSSALGVTAAWESVRYDLPGKNPGHGYMSRELAIG